MKDIPWFNRPWTKIKRNGVEQLDDAELLALIFVKGNKKQNAVELSNSLLTKSNFHTFHKQSLTQLTTILGDEVKAYQILATSEICRRYAKLQMKGFSQTIESSRDVYNYFASDLQNKVKEHLYVLILDAQHKILQSELISVGTLTKSFAHPREVFRSAIKEAAHSIILVHNHPSGDTNPSSEDLKITRQLMQAGSVLGIKVLDHIIIGNNQYWSHLDAGVKVITSELVVENVACNRKAKE